MCVFPADREREYARNARFSFVGAASLETVVLPVPGGDLLCPPRLSLFFFFLFSVGLVPSGLG